MCTLQHVHFVNLVHILKLFHTTRPSVRLSVTRFKVLKPACFQPLKGSTGKRERCRCRGRHLSSPHQQFWGLYFIFDFSGVSEKIFVIPCVQYACWAWSWVQCCCPWLCWRLEKLVKIRVTPTEFAIGGDLSPPIGGDTWGGDRGPRGAGGIGA